MEYKYGNTLIRIKQGYREIGGNFIIIEDKDNTLVFDQGIRFSRFKNIITLIFNHQVPQN